MGFVQEKSCDTLLVPVGNGAVSICKARLVWIKLWDSEPPYGTAQMRSGKRYF